MYPCVSLLSDLTDEKYTSFFSPSGNLHILIKTRHKAGMEKRQDDGDVLLVIGLLCDQQDWENLSSLVNGC